MEIKQFVARPIIFMLLVLVLCLPARADEKTNSISMEFVLIPTGSFTMGEGKDFEVGGFCDKTPKHQVTISKPFYLSKHEVTQEQWLTVMGWNPSYFKGPSNPVEQVFWDEVQEFVKKLNQKEHTTKYRLPTEAKWEYAARAGTISAYSFGDDARQLGQYGWYKANSGQTTLQLVS